MSRTLSTAVMVLVTSSLVSPALADGNVNFMVGLRSLEGDVWDTLDDQILFGAMVDLGDADWPVHIEIGAFYSDDKLTDTILGFGSLSFSASVADVGVGVQKGWDLRHGFRPFVGGGLAVATAHVAISGAGVHLSDSDTSAGIYGHGGILWRIQPRLNVGLDLRALRGTDIELAGMEDDADYLQVSLLLGWGWPAR